MTRNEAVERARQIWGGQVVKVTWAGSGRWDGPISRANIPPGDSEWYVELANGNRHEIDCNGHPTCHMECDVASVAVCP